MKRETYKGRKIKVVAGRGADHGYTRITLNGVDRGKWLQSEDEALRSTRGTIDHADEVGISSGRYGAEWYTPGSYELCEHGHAMETGGECGHDYCVSRRPAPVADDPASATEFVAELLASWQAARADLHEIERTEHPDITDRFGRVWTWKSKDLYRHCGTACTADMISGFGLPTQRALDNPNYDLCDICVGGRGRHAPVCKPEWSCTHRWCHVRAEDDLCRTT